MLILLGGIGLLTVAERDAPSGLAALVIASVPLWVLVLRAALGDPPRPRTLASVGAGLTGMGLVIFAGASVDAQSSALAVVMGSIVAYTAFVWLLDNASVPLVATYAYVTPVVAVARGWAVLDEAITLPIALGALVVIGSVAGTPADDRTP